MAIAAPNVAHHQIISHGPGQPQISGSFRPHLAPLAPAAPAAHAFPNPGFSALAHAQPLAPFQHQGVFAGQFQHQRQPLLQPGVNPYLQQATPYSSFVQF